MKNIAIFASGTGTNAENIIRYFESSDWAKVTLLVCDRPGAPVIGKAKNLGVECLTVSRGKPEEDNRVLQCLKQREIDFIVLAGFLSLVPSDIIKEYRGRIVNIHPALLPSYGGKGMYGDRVHGKVIENREKESGITIHEVNENYDEGKIIAQFRVAVAPDDTVQTLATKIHELEYAHYPEVIEREIMKQ